MNQIFRLLVISIIICWFQFDSEALSKPDQSTSKYSPCSFIEDRRLTSFSTINGQPQSQYWCQTPGWQLLIRN